MTRLLFRLALSGIACAPLLASPAGAASPENNFFGMVVSKGAAACLPKAKARVTIAPRGTVENMHVEAFGLPKNTGFDLFVIQVPGPPFGMSWYQGDLQTDSDGIAVGDFVGRFSKETFVVAPGTASAPNTFPSSPFPDATANPPTNPLQMYHLGIWFNSPADAKAAGCPTAETPFNGEHTAGIQVLNTADFPDLSGPLLKIP